MRLIERLLMLGVVPCTACGQPSDAKTPVAAALDSDRLVLSTRCRSCAAASRSAVEHRQVASGVLQGKATDPLVVAAAFTSIRCPGCGVVGSPEVTYDGCDADVAYVQITCSSCTLCYLGIAQGAHVSALWAAELQRYALPQGAILTVSDVLDMQEAVRQLTKLPQAIIDLQDERTVRA